MHDLRVNVGGRLGDPTKISIRPIEKSVAKKLIVENGELPIIVE